MNKMKLLLTLALPVFIGQELHAQSTRLTAQATWMHNGAEFKRNDSTAYSYLSTSRGGDLNSLLKFDESLNWSFVAGDSLNNNARELQEFDASNNLTTKITQTWNSVAGTWDNQFKYIYTYNSANKVTSMVTQHWDGTSAWVTDSKNVYSYNAANQLSTDLFQAWDGAAYVSASQVTYYYDASGNKINETSVNFVSSSPVFNTKVDYTYNSANKLLTATNATWDGASWDNIDMQAHTYDTANRKTSSLHQNWNGTAFVNDMIRLYSDFTPAGSAQTEILQTWDTAGTGSWVDMNKFTHSYNSSNQLTSSVRQSMDISIGWTYAMGDTRNNYYYGTFVTVKNVSNAGGDANFYPVPAQSVLNVELNWNKAQSATLTINDMTGRAITTVALPTTAKHQVAVPVNNLANGMYTVVINGAEGQIVKQIVVAH
jgi:hypothetical protein